jgi:hypothetical protein
VILTHCERKQHQKNALLIASMRELLFVVKRRHINPTKKPQARLQLDGDIFSAA